MYLQTHQSILTIHGAAQYFPSTISFNFIFLTAAILSSASIGLAILLRQNAVKMAIPDLA
jgi:hypothetical protein